MKVGLEASHMRPLFSVIGPTATGKTATTLGLVEWLWRQYQSDHPPKSFPTPKALELVSVDSKQVFSGLEVTTGADLPAGWSSSTNSTPAHLRDLLPTSLRFWQHPNMPVRLHGVSIIEPYQNWSARHFQALLLWTLESFPDSWVILVGGTGFYHHTVHQSLANVTNQPKSSGTTDHALPGLKVPPDPKLRAFWQEQSLDDLQEAVYQQAPSRWESLNNSDRHNPRRLIRILELAQAGFDQPTQPTPPSSPTSRKSSALRVFASQKSPTQVLASQTSVYQASANKALTLQTSDLTIGPTIGLKASWDFLRNKIRKRVELRLEAGAKPEVKSLLNVSEPPAQLIKAVLGVKEVSDFLAGKLTHQQCIDNWTKRELAFAKRQMTWWRKHKPTRWFQTTDYSNSQDLATDIGQFLLY